jgi:hypothetical protein
MWKGTEVAVKVITAKKVMKEMALGFQDEVPLPCLETRMMLVQ